MRLALDPRPVSQHVKGTVLPTADYDQTSRVEVVRALASLTLDRALTGMRTRSPVFPVFVGR